MKWFQSLLTVAVISMMTAPTAFADREWSDYSITERRQAIDEIFPAESNRPAQLESSIEGVVSISEQLELRGSSLRRTIDDVHWDLDHISDVIDWLGHMELGAGGPITKQVGALVHESLSRTLILMAAIANDPQLDLEKKKEAIVELNASFGAIFYKVLRHHGQDEINIDDELTAMEQIKNIIRELVLDPKTLLWGSRSADGKLVWNAWERVQREKLSREMIGLMGQYAEETLPNMTDERFAKFFRIDWVKDMVRGLRIRGQRLLSQKVVTGIYYGMAAWAMFGPTVDWIGLLNGRSENSLMVSDLVTASAFVLFGTVKLLATSGKTIDMLKALKAFLENPAEGLRQPVANFWERLIQRVRRKSPLGAGLCVDVFAGT